MKGKNVGDHVVIQCPSLSQRFGRLRSCVDFPAGTAPIPGEGSRARTSLCQIWRTVSNFTLRMRFSRAENSTTMISESASRFQEFDHDARFGVLRAADVRLQSAVYHQERTNLLSISFWTSRKGRPQRVPRLRLSTL